MAKRKQVSVSPSIVKGVFLLLIFVAIFVFIFSEIKDFFLNSPYFRIKTIVIEDPNLQFIEKQDLARLKGKSIFLVDANQLQRQLAFRYPQVAALKVMKNFPNQISIVARKRFPLAQVAFHNRLLTVDVNGAVLSLDSSLDPNLTSVSGIKLNNGRLSVGSLIKDDRLTMALKLIRQIKMTPSLGNIKITKINMESLSGIEIYLPNDFKIILDQDSAQDKLNVLAMILSQRQVDLNTLNYIDLRFNEPVLGKKDKAT
jgi:cell division septal protein FtsQ